MPKGPTREVDVDGHRVELTHLDKVLYEDDGFTKAQMLDYYSRISEVMIPHIKDRAVTLKRYPHGAGGPFFFEKNCPQYHPKWMKSVGIYSESSEREVNYCVINDLASLIWLANQSTIEFHVPMALRRSIERPRAVVFDLDPGDGMTSVNCAEVALALRERVAEDGLEAFPKSSGSKGVHVLIPLNKPRMTFDRTKDYAHKIATELQSEREDVVANMRKALRKDHVFIDWSQNSTHKTTAAAYTLRAARRPTVSAPLTWDELGEAVDADDSELLLHTTDDVLERVKDAGDLFADVLSLEQTLPR
jgi:bifunctional non-homologous end joining protein LigD